MRILFLHPEDAPWQGEWGGQRWDLIVDLGFASPHRYDEWSRRVGSRVLSIFQSTGDTDGFRWVNRVFECGRGRLLDSMGIDWWEVLAMESYHDLRILYLFHQLRREITGADVEYFGTRPHLFTKFVEQIVKKPVHNYQDARRGPISRVAQMLRSARKFRPEQIAEISFDKWDPAYGLRRRVTKHKRARLADSAVLLPSAYFHVTRSALAYAGHLPNRRFLLATTRRSALPDQLPVNVTAAPLSAYVRPLHNVKAESAELQVAWDTFRRTMSEVEEFRQGAEAGLWDYFPAHLQQGLHLREAWKQLLELEPITGVLCGDDLNYHTRLPLMLAHRGDRNAVYCSHGALDGGFLFKMPFADSFLVKGEMEKNYLQSACAISPEKILVGAPARSTGAGWADQKAGALVFFSQPYEVEGGRAEEIYRELLPLLSTAADRSGHKLTIKLHPFESRQARKALAASILPADACKRIEITSDISPDTVMTRAWCGVTVDSSIAVECTLRRIPCFLCGWLDFGGMGYLQQFARYGAGRVLASPVDIERIPETIADWRVDPAVIARLWQEVDSKQLDEILFGHHKVRSSDPCAF